MIRAVVISENHYNGLGIIRSLGEEDISVSLILTTTEIDTYIDYSKYVERTVKVSGEEKEILKAVNQIVKSSNDIYFLFPVTDFSAMVIDKNLSTFPQNVVFPHMTGNMYKMQNKSVAKIIAQQCGIAVVNSIEVNFKDGKKVIWDEYPAIVKPLISIEGRKSDIAIVRDCIELERELDRFAKMRYDQVMIERYIYGQDEYMLEIQGCSSESKVEIVGIIKKEREYPMHRGSTSYARVLNIHPAVNYEIVKEFIRKTKYVGIFDLELKYVDGVAYYIECNFRNGAPSYAFTLKGKNVPMLWISIMCDKDTDASDDRFEESNFMCEQTDLLNALKKEVPITKWIKEYISSNHIFCRKNDLRPSNRYYWLMLKECIKRILMRKNA